MDILDKLDTLDILKMVKNDPLWPDHSEITKKTLGRAIDEIERLRTQAKRHEAEIAELVAALKLAKLSLYVGMPYYDIDDTRDILGGAIAKYEVKNK